MPSPFRTGPFLSTVLLSLAIAGCGLAPVAPVKTGTLRASAPLQAAGLDTFMRDVFKQADRDRSGALSRAESGLLAAQFAVLDRDGNGALTQSEWEAKARNHQVEESLPTFLPFVLDLYRQLDTDSNRKVTLAEVHRATEGPAAVDMLAPASLDAAFKASDRDRSAALDGDEFQRFYLEAAEVASNRGLFRRLAFSLLGTYVAITSRIAARIAVKATRLPIKETPAKFGLSFDTVTLRTADGLNLKAWYVPAKVKTDKAVVLLHGRSDSREMFIRQRQIEWLAPHYNVIAVDLRNHGESEGDHTSFAYDEYQDAAAAVEYLKSRGNTRIAAYGISLGGATAIHAAEHVPDIAAVVDDCTYATVVSAFKGFVSFAFIPNPVLIAAAAVVNVNRTYGIDMTHAEPLNTLPKLGKRPLMVFHGEQDQYITPENGRIIHQLAQGPKSIWIVPGAQHAVSAQTAPEGYRDRLLAFLKASL